MCGPVLFDSSFSKDLARLVPVQGLFKVFLNLNTKSCSSTPGLPVASSLKKSKIKMSLVSN
jgi:hypothetical protein